MNPYEIAKDFLEETPTQKPAHTPSPWSIEDSGYIRIGRYAYHLVSDSWATVELSPDEMKVNAQLIAAAPDMLSALKAVYSDLCRQEDDGKYPWGLAPEGHTKDVLEWAIAKAEGTLDKSQESGAPNE